MLQLKQSERELPLSLTRRGECFGATMWTIRGVGVRWAGQVTEVSLLGSRPKGAKHAIWNNLSDKVALAKRQCLLLTLLPSLLQLLLASLLHLHLASLILCCFLLFSSFFFFYATKAFKALQKYLHKTLLHSLLPALHKVFTLNTIILCMCVTFIILFLESSPSPRSRSSFPSTH